MRRLSGLDASFLYAETPTVHMHTLKVLLLDLPPGCREDPTASVRHALRERLHLLPLLRRRIVRVPWEVSHPRWIEDAHFDLDAHLQQVTLAEGADMAALERVVSRFASVPLDHRRPLWRAMVVSGLAGGRVAFVLKIHHSLADGGAVAQLLADIASPDPDAPLHPAARRWHPEVAPSRIALLLVGVRERARQVGGLPSLVGRTVIGLAQQALRRRTMGVHSPGIFGGPPTPFNARLTQRRVFATRSLSLDRVKEVKSAFDCSINDVVLALVAGALREHLSARGLELDSPLVAGVPVGLGTDGPHRQGNRVSHLLMPLHVDIADPLERLLATRSAALVAKELHDVLGRGLLQRWSELAQRGALRWIWQRFVPASPRPPINLVVSNVPGPRETLYIAGARLLGLWSVGPILEHIGLNVTVWSYERELNFAAIACPEHLPDLPLLMQRHDVALDELVICARHERAGAEEQPVQ